MERDEITSIILGTSNYDNAKSGNTVSITGDGGNAWGYYGPACKKLAPRYFTYFSYAEKYQELLMLKEKLTNEQYSKYKKQIEDEYILSYYETRLEYLDVYELLEFLRRKYGKDIIMLCHEPILEFCHRRLVADYIELQTGVYIPEVTVSEDGNVKKINPIRYKNRLMQIISER